MNKWVNPPPRMKTEDEFPPQDATTYIPPTSFDTIKKQVKKKKVSRKSTKERIADNSVSLAENLGMRKD
jgi:hypothetical protein